HGVLDAVAAPGRPDAAFHGPQSLAIGVATFHAGVDDFLPDVRKLLYLGAEQVDALAAGYFRVEPIFFGNAAEGDELVGRDFAAGNSWHHGIKSATLHVSQKT